MHDAVDQLDQYADNEILDHLRWHLSQKRQPVSIVADCLTSASPVVILEGIAPCSQVNQRLWPVF